MEKIDYSKEQLTGKQLSLKTTLDKENVEKIKLYRVKLEDETFLSSSEGSIFVDNICRYEHEEAIKKARVFGGKAVHINEFEIRKTIINSFFKTE